MCRPYGWVLGPKFSRQRFLFRQIFHENGWDVKKLTKIAKNGSFSAKIHHKSRYDSKFRKKVEESTFLKTGRQISVHPQVMYPSPPPVGETLRKIWPLTLLVLGDFLLTLFWVYLRNYKSYNNKAYSNCSLDSLLLKYNNDNKLVTCFVARQPKTKEN